MRSVHVVTTPEGERGYAQLAVLSRISVVPR